MARLNTEQETKRALAGKNTYIIRYVDQDGSVARWPIVAASRDIALKYVKAQLINLEFEIEKIYPTPIIIL